MIKYVLALLIGVVCGLVAGFQGIAGSFYILTLLLVFGIAKNQRQAAGTTLLTIVFPLSVGAVYEYYKTGDVDVPVAACIIIAYFIAAAFGAKANALVDEKYVLFSIAFMLFISSFYYIHKAMAIKGKK
jgi:uncharacterized membrane protein YfcA